VVRRQRWCDLMVIIDDLLERGELAPTDDDIGEWDEWE